MNQLNRLATATRVFAVAAVTGIGLLSPDYRLLLPVLLLAVLAAGGSYLSATSAFPPTAVVIAEAVVTGLLIGTALPEGVALLPYLAALCLVAGLLGGPLTVAAVVGSELATMSLVLLSLSAPFDGGSLTMSLAPWVLTGIGLGTLGTWLRAIGAFTHSATDPAYSAAYRLVTQLRTVAKRLSYGLDSTLIAREICAEVAAATRARDVAVFIRSEGAVITPVAYFGEGAVELPTPGLKDFAGCWTEQEPTVVATETGGPLVGLPLRAGVRLVGVIVARVSERPSEGILTSLSTQLEVGALRLDTALAFDHVRSIATSEERHRLAREIHDGIAQEIAGIGYAVDDLTKIANTDEQREGLTALRDELTRIVSELRLSIFDLRSDVIGQTGLGQALSDYLRQVGARSNITIHLTLDEAPSRLRPEVEAELLRIVQEATTNARKHSGARNLWVICRVSPPEAMIEVRDDGAGMGTARNDSYGLRIMRERADRLGAALEVHSQHGESSSGTVVTVTIPSPTITATERVKRGAEA